MGFVTAVTGCEERATGSRSPYAAVMASKSKPAAEGKKPGRSLKEKRAAKHQKQAENKQSRKGWEAK